MADAEESLRQQAVARVLAGEPAPKVAADLGRTDRWVRKWVARYDPADPMWATEFSRTPATSPNKTPADVEKTVLEIRARLMDNPWAQVGSGAIAWEMTKLGIEPPSSWTIERIVARAGVPKRRARPDKYVPKGTPYPAAPMLVRPGAWHEADLVGPRHLGGGVGFYALNAVDVGRRKTAIEVLPDKTEYQIARGLIRIWSRLGVPGGLKLDNGKTLQGMHGHLAVPVWLACSLGVRVRFIPFGEPWRNGVIEHFNDVFDKRFFRTERFDDLRALKRQAAAFERFHNSSHRYSVLKRATPNEWERKLGFEPKPLDPSTAVPTKRPRRGVVEFVRLIRSDRLLRVLDEEIPMPEKLIHRYVTATLSVRTERLVIQAHGIYYRKELRFPLKG